jgi:hypothetical protein
MLEGLGIVDLFSVLIVVFGVTQCPVTFLTATGVPLCFVAPIRALLAPIKSDFNELKSDFSASEFVNPMCSESPEV